jgi:hypothetical protein
MKNLIQGCVFVLDILPAVYRQDYRKITGMRKSFFSVVILFIGSIFFSGCIKNTPYTPTTNPQLTANIGTYTFVAGTVVTATIDTQIHDSVTNLVITGTSSDDAHPYDYIQLRITKYKHTTGVFSIVQQQAFATYVHTGLTGSIADTALGGVVAITSYTSNTLIGYFSFDTQNLIHVGNGAFIANLP